jgi:hypothetical protein
MRFIGDVHGLWGRYQKLAKAVPASIQVGDFGMGFGQKHPFTWKDDKAAYRDHKFIRGNHDSPSHCARVEWWIPDGTVWNDSMMFVGGALSIDAAFRTEGVSWWRDEELSLAAMDKIITKYEAVKPSIMVTHECPNVIARVLFPWMTKQEYPSRTRQLFDTLWEIHSPKLWVFGHWHEDKDVIIDDCRFICLNELSHIDLDLKEYE